MAIPIFKELVARRENTIVYLKRLFRIPLKRLSYCVLICAELTHEFFADEPDAFSTLATASRCCALV